MENFSSMSKNVDTQHNNVNNSLTNIKNISFEGIWSGDAYNSLSKALQQVIANTDTAQADLEKFSEVLAQLDKYKALKEEIEALTAEINSITIPSDPQQAAAAMSKKNSLIAKRDKLITEKNQLRQVIEATLATFEAMEKQIEVINFDINQYKGYLDYIIDVDELLALYMNGKKDDIPGDGLVKLGYLESLGEYYNDVDENGNVIKNSGIKKIEDMILEIQSQYSGREAAVNSALLILSLAADKGVKIDYESRGTSSSTPYIKTKQVLSGVDCNPFASWVIDKGTPGGFQWRPVPGFTKVGTTIEDWTKAQPGDVFVTVTDRKNGYGHVGVIIENDPVNQIFITAEAANPTDGIVLKTQSYQALSKNNYSVQDMTAVYDGTENTNRETFNDEISDPDFDRGI